jgi:hypothetical protein
MPALSVMRTAVLAEADSVGVVDNSVVDSILNEELAALHDLLVESFEDYTVTSADVTVLANTDAIALPATFYKVRSVEDTASTAEPLPRFNWEERKRVSRKAYVIFGANLIVRPVENVNRTYKVWFVPVFTALTAEADIFAAPNNWHQLAVLNAAARIKDLQQLGSAALTERAEKVRTRIESAAKHRDAGEPAKVRDVRFGRWFARQLEYHDPEPY